MDGWKNGRGGVSCLALVIALLATDCASLAQPEADPSPGQGEIRLEPSTTRLRVPESGTAVVTVRPSTAPDESLVLDAKITHGSETFALAAPARLVFDASNWNVAQAVIVSATADEDRHEDRGILEIRGPGLLQVVLLQVDSRQIEPRTTGVRLTVKDVAGVGATEEELVAAGTEFLKASIPFTGAAKGRAVKEEHGLCKFLLTPGGEILGCHIVGHEAATLLHEVIPVMKWRNHIESLTGIIHVHPSLAEIVRNAARKAAALVG